MNSEPPRSVKIDISSGAIIKIILISFAFVLLFVLRDIVLIVLTAIVIASAVEPATHWLVARKIPRVFSVFMLYVAMGIVFAGIVYLFVPTLLEDTANFLNSVPQYADSVPLWDSATKQTATNIANSVSQGITQSTAVAQNIASPTFSIGDAIGEINTATSNVSGGLLKTVSFVFGGVTSFVLIVVISFYLAVQDGGIEKFLRIATPLKHEKYAIDLWRRTQKKIGRWMQGQIVLMVLVAILVYLALTVIGVKNALLFACFAGLMEIIPLFGPVIAAVLPAIAAYTASGIPIMLVVIGAFLVIQQFENHLIYPLVVTKIVGVPPILVILSLIIGFELAGFLGIILSVPLSATLVEFIDDMQRDRIANHPA
ncbi:MAG TPA: AI-2E family transporter [Candidatus Paceibacterota bacterium]|nr:AI-2E family transporter [Candidatus Paceibacterota bacterium]